MITDIHLQNFRSYSDDSIELSPKVNIVVGPNASGKTNLLEAILVICQGYSYRAKDIDLIKFGKPWARLEAHTEDFDRIVKIEKVDEQKTTKSFTVNTKLIKRLRLDQTIPVVLFEPNHLLLLIGPPELRRTYLDNVLEQSVAGFKSTKAQYKRALGQRNSLLKSNRPSKQNLFVWNIRLSELGGKIFNERIKLVGRLQKDIKSLYKSISGGKKTISLAYQTTCSPNNYETSLLHNLESNIEKDIDRGFTSYGPHRDDLAVFIDDNQAGEVASRGETRTILLALKMIETKVIEEQRDKKPLLLLDDVFSELDGARRLALTSLLNDYQAFITTTDAEIVVQHFTEAATIIPTG